MDDLVDFIAMFKRDYKRDDLAGLPPAVFKSIYDPFMYQVALADGTKIDFREARYSSDHPEFITLIQESDTGLTPLRNCDRGIEVRIAHIVWAADAPYGS